MKKRSMGGSRGGRGDRGVTTPMEKENLLDLQPRQTHISFGPSPLPPCWKNFLDPRMRSKRFPRSNARCNI